MALRRDLATPTPTAYGIAYRVMSDGPLDVVWVPGLASNLEFNWDDLVHSHIFERLGSFAVARGV